MTVDTVSGVTLRKSNDRQVPLSTLQNNNYVNSAFTHKTASLDKPSSGQFKDEIGRIGYFKQGNTGDCYALAGLIALSQSDKGRRFIKDNVKRDKDGNCHVTFRGFKENNTFTVSKAEYESFENAKLSTGDTTTKVIEIAYRKCLTQNGTAAQKFQSEKLNGGHSEDFIRDFTGLNSETTESLFSASFRYERKTSEKVIALLDDLATKKGNFSVTVASKSEEDASFGFFNWHAYCMCGVDKKNKRVSIIDPHNTSQTISLSYDEFLGNYKRISVHRM